MEINEYLGLPKEWNIKARMPKKAFTDNPEFDLKKEEKTILKEYVENIYLEYSLKPQVINIPKYEDEDIRYEEIEIIKVKIADKTKEKKVCELIQKYIPYPIFIIVEFNNFIKFNISIKKINKNEKEKLTIDNMIYSEWIDINNINEKEGSFLESLSFKNITTNNLFTVYQGFINSLNNFETSKYKEKFEIKEESETSKDIEVLEKIKKCEQEIIKLRSDLKKESNMGAKVELNVKIKKLQKKIEVLKNNLK